MGTGNMSGDEGKGGDGTERAAKPASTGRTLVEYALLAVVAVAVALLIQAFLVKPYRIPSESMENTLLIGDRVLVDRVSWRFAEPQRGEIIVFHPPPPLTGGPVLIKRIIGMPGDMISLRDGYVYINGARLNEPYVRTVGGRQERTEPFTNGLAWSLQRPYTRARRHVLHDGRQPHRQRRQPRVRAGGPVAARGQRVLAAIGRPAVSAASRRQVNERFAYDAALAGTGLVAGADEAGRGCLAGPLVAAAVCFDWRRSATRTTPLSRPRRLQEAHPGAREALYGEILRRARQVVVSCCCPRPSTASGCTAATSPCSAGAEALRPQPGVVLVDGFALPGCACEHERGHRRRRSLRGRRRRLDRRQGHAGPGHDRLHAGLSAVRLRPPRRATRPPLTRRRSCEHGVCELHRLSFASVAYQQLGLGLGERRPRS